MIKEKRVIKNNGCVNELESRTTLQTINNRNKNSNIKI